MLRFVSTVGVFTILLFIEEQIKVEAVAARVEATAPLELVKEGGILSLHCQIWHAKADQSVSISKRSGGVLKKISFGKGIIKELENNKNYFLAHRKLKDSSDVYFLSVTDVSRDHAGEYICDLLKEEEWGVQTSGSVYIGIRYFPSESFPVCDPQGPQRIREGETMVLNCSSEAGNPPVDIHWSRSGNVDDPLQAEVNKGAMGVYSQHSFQARMSDKDAMFECKIESKYFTARSDQKCHMGPLSVIPNPDIQYTTTVANHVQITEPKYTLINNTGGNNDDECHEVCTEMTAESIFRWTIATVIAGLLALVFFVFGIVLLIRYCFALDEQQQCVPPPPQEEMHDMPDMSNVQYHINGNRLYMTLERPSTSQTEAVYQGGEVLERQYILAPSRGDGFDHVDGSYHVEGSYLGTPSLRDMDPPYQRTPMRRDSYTKSTDSPLKCIELEPESMDTSTMSDDIDRPSYHGTPIHNGGASMSLQGTPTHRVLMDQVLLEAQSEGYMLNPGSPQRRESEGYIGGPSRGDSERFLFGTPTRGDYTDRQRCLTPTLPPRRYKTHYV